ncbi:MAG: DUF1214 domain-containing protein [Rhodospirillaceae bacterium]|nr:MAG: DUF1214 domain-containing protein [Rhodospirillaceae bacterium]
MTRSSFEWVDLIESLRTHASVIERISTPADPVLRQEAVQLLAMSIAQGYHMLFSHDREHPEFISFLNPVIKSAAPNPDYMYYHAAIEGNGDYRMTGLRGTSRFVHVSFVAGVVGEADQAGPSVGHFDLDKMTIAEDGAFDIRISSERPAGYGGDWVKLDTRVTGISIRQASYDWIGEVDGRFAIERLDRNPAGRRWTALEIVDRLRQLAGFPARFLEPFLGFVAGLEKLPSNTLKLNDWASIGGLAGQVYYEGRFEIAQDEVLLIETDVPKTARYWSILLADLLFNTIDWVNCQSSLNGFQAQVDDDGRFRAVLSAQDPGVHNWLDPAGRLSGVIQGRWLECSSAPLPSITRLKLKDLRARLPDTTRYVSTAEREAQLRRRHQGAQFRRKW